MTYYCFDFDQGSYGRNKPTSLSILERAPRMHFLHACFNQFHTKFESSVQFVQYTKKRVDTELGHPSLSPCLQ
jgi:hypothetical protein